MDVSNELAIQKHLLTSSSQDPGSNFVHLLLDTFVLESSNGTHACFVSEPMGPSVSGYLTAPFKYYDPLKPQTRRFPVARTKKFLKNVLSALHLLHGNNIVYRDLHPGNLLFSLGDLNATDPSKLEQNERNSHIDPVTRVDGKVDRWAPRYLVAPKPLSKQALPQNQQVIKLADLGGGMFPSFRCPNVGEDV